MKHILLTLISLLYLCEITEGQELYFKPYCRYHQSVMSQIAPQYFTLELEIPLSFANYRYIPVTSYIEEFSMASGIQYGGALGYHFNELIGVELGIDFFGRNKTISSDELSDLTVTGTTDWNYKSWHAIPLITFGKCLKKSYFGGKAGAIIGIAWLEPENNSQ